MCDLVQLLPEFRFHIINRLELSKHLLLLQFELLCKVLCIVLIFTHQVTSHVDLVHLCGCHHACEVQLIVTIFLIMALICQELSPLEAEMLVNFTLLLIRLLSV